MAATSTSPEETQQQSKSGGNAPKSDSKPASEAEEAKADAATGEAAYSARLGDESKPAGSNADSHGQSEKGSNETPGPESEKQPEAKSEPKLDPQTEKLVDERVASRIRSEIKPMIEARLDALLTVNRELALFLGGQMDSLIELRQKVIAMEQFIESNPVRKGKYAAELEKAKGQPDPNQKDPQWFARTRGMLAILERTGTLGPKRDDNLKPES